MRPTRLQKSDNIYLQGKWRWAEQTRLGFPKCEYTKDRTNFEYIIIIVNFNKLKMN